MNSLGRQFGSTVLAELQAYEARAKKSAGKSELAHLATPARSLLRLRCAFGANARAEIILELLDENEGGRGRTVLALSELGYSKRNVALVLDELVLAGVVTSNSEGNRARYRISNADAVRETFGPIPKSGHWHVRLPIIAEFVKLALRIHNKDAMVQSVEAHKLYERLRPRLELLDLPPLPMTIAGSGSPSFTVNTSAARQASLSVACGLPGPTSRSSQKLRTNATFSRRRDELSLNVAQAW